MSSVVKIWKMALANEVLKALFNFYNKISFIKFQNLTIRLVQIVYGDKFAQSFKFFYDLILKGFTLFYVRLYNFMQS